MMGGGSSKGFGGGSGGGIGSGMGVGRGNGKNFVGAFGASFKRPNALEGTLYDLKFSPSGKALGADQAERIAQIQKAFETMDRNWSGTKALLDARYRQAELKLYASNIFIPPRSAAEATKAFDCEKEIQAPGWLAYYEGNFSPPVTGKYRFVGLGAGLELLGLVAGGAAALAGREGVRVLLDGVGDRRDDPDGSDENQDQVDDQRDGQALAAQLLPERALGAGRLHFLDGRHGGSFRRRFAVGRRHRGVAREGCLGVR